MKRNGKTRYGLAALNVNHSQRNQASLKEHWSISSLYFLTSFHSSLFLILSPLKLLWLTAVCRGFPVLNLAVLVCSILRCWLLFPSWNSLAWAAAFFFFFFFLYSYPSLFLESLSGLTPSVGFSRSQVTITQGECKGCVKCIINMPLIAVAHTE